VTTRDGRGSSVSFRLAEFELYPSTCQLRQAGTPVSLTGQPLEVLLLLIERAGVLVSREELAERLWGARGFGDVDAAIHTAVLKIRRALGDVAGTPLFVETVPRKGYRFVAPIERLPAPPSIADGAALLPPRHNLAERLTSFVGRSRELAELAGLISSSRLLTLTGAGGVGKTRLSIRLGIALVDRYRDGIWLIDLAPLSAPDLIVPTIASTLGVREVAHRSLSDTLAVALARRETLLVLDNCEHLLDSTAPLVELLLRGAPGVSILVTSREPLRIDGEVIWRVPSLTLPDEQTASEEANLNASEATRLFLERARTIDTGFSVTPPRATAIARICRRLDGIPLAIELAAARVGVLTPEQIETRLDDRFRLLISGSRTVLPRQRTLAAAVDWSYQMLSAVEQETLERLSVFPSSWTMLAAEHICSDHPVARTDVLDLIARLATKSLVLVEVDDGEERRYRLLETVRDYARERSVERGGLDRSRQRHFEFVLDAYRHAERVLRGPQQIRQLRLLDLEQENVRAALAWGLSSPKYSAGALELVGALFWYWTKRGLFSEGREWIERALSTADNAPEPLRARALIGLAHLRYFQGHDIQPQVDEIETLGRTNSDAWVIAFACFLQALAMLERKDRQKATLHCLTAIDAAAASGDMWLKGGPLVTLANITLAEGDLHRARSLYDESLAVLRHAGDPWGLSIVLSASAGLSLLEKNLVRARQQVEEALTLSQTLGDQRGIAWSLDTYAALLAVSERWDEAAQVWGSSDELMARVGTSLVPGVSWLRERYLERTQAELGRDRFAQALDAGRLMSLDGAVAFAISCAAGLEGKLSLPITPSEL
jgi:predicted ATPase/DNA-binding winged helix-turn-helix (wHTH) protein